MKPAVLHCYADYKWTGPSEPVVLLCRELLRRGWPVKLACQAAVGEGNRCLPGEARRMGVPVDDGFAFSGRSAIGHNVRDAERLSRLIEDGGFALVHAHGSWDHVVAAWAARRGPSRPPVLRTDHGGRQFRGHPLERFQFGPRLTDHLIVLCDQFRTRALERLRRAPSTVTTVRGAVDASEFRPRTPPPGLRARLGFKDTDVVFALVARVQRHRRFDVLLKAAEIARRTEPRVKIVVLGRGTRKQELLDLPVARRWLGDTVFPLGYRRDDYRDVLAAADAGLMLVPGSDGSCRAAMQLAAMAKPLVVARRGVLPDIVLDGVTGIVVQDTPRLLAEALCEMAGLSPEQRAAWGRAGRERVIECFNLDRQVEAVIAVYEAVLARRT